MIFHQGSSVPTVYMYCIYIYVKTNFDLGASDKIRTIQRIIRYVARILSWLATFI